MLTGAGPSGKADRQQLQSKYGSQPPMPALRLLPNLLTILRLILAPLAAIRIAERDFPVAVLLVTVASLTDLLDGYLARTLHWQSKVGGYLDPIADKVLLASVFLALGYAGIFPWWLVALVFARDLSILAAGLLLMALTPLRDFAPTFWGKVSTTVQMTAAAAALLAQLEPLALLGVLIAPAVWLVAAATVWSGLHYGWTALVRLRLSRKESGGRGIGSPQYPSRA